MDQMLAKMNWLAVLAVFAKMNSMNSLTVLAVLAVVALLAVLVGLAVLPHVATSQKLCSHHAHMDSSWKLSSS